MSTPNKPFLRYEQSGAVVTLTMDSPETRNALTGSSAPQEFVDACARIAADSSVRAVILTGAGPAFSSGGNLKHMREMFDHSPAQLREWYRTGVQRLANAVYDLEVPLIAAVNGPAIGAGCDLACMCDIRMGTPSSRFGETFAKLALVPGDGGTFFLQRVVGYAKAMELSLTGRIVEAEEALRLGLLNQLVEPATLRSETERLARDIAGNSPVAVSMIKKAIRQARTAEISGHLDLLAAFQGITQRTEDHFERVRALKEKRPSRPKGT